MEPFYIGPTDRQLFAIYYPPAGAPRAGGIVICPPVFAEYVRTYGCSRTIAIRLAEQGYPVVRFDYLGTGDSAGELNDITMSDWQDDIRAVSQELRELAGVDDISLLGIRFGATLAALALARGSASTAVLWDPILSGSPYIEKIRETQWRLICDHGALSAGEIERSRNEVVGFEISDALRDQISSLQLDRDCLKNLGESSSRVIASKVMNDEQLDQLRDANIALDKVDYDCGWTTVAETAMLPHPILEAITRAYE